MNDRAYLDVLRGEVDPPGRRKGTTALEKLAERVSEDGMPKTAGKVAKLRRLAAKYVKSKGGAESEGVVAALGRASGSVGMRMGKLTHNLESGKVAPAFAEARYPKGYSSQGSQLKALPAAVEERFHAGMLAGPKAAGLEDAAMGTGNWAMRSGRMLEKLVAKRAKAARAAKATSSKTAKAAGGNKKVSEAQRQKIVAVAKKAEKRKRHKGGGGGGGAKEEGSAVIPLVAGGLGLTGLGAFLARRGRHKA